MLVARPDARGDLKSAILTLAVEPMKLGFLQVYPLDHASRKEFEPLKYLRKAHNFNKKRAVRVPKIGYRQDGSAVYRKGNEYLILRPDNFGVEKIVTYGVNDD